MDIIFCCIECKNTLINIDNQLICRNCQNIYHLEDGIFLFSKSKHYYSDLDRDRMNSLINDSKNNGWKHTISSKFQDNPFLVRIIMDESRADWQYLLPLNNQTVALDIGAGWGTICIPLARNIKQVVALEGTKDRIDFLNLRANQEKIDNLIPVHADIFKHPFAPGQFDLVSFNGVLEWVSMGDNNDIDPRGKQLEALKIAYDLLKNGGYLYIGIENSYGIKYLLGEPDDHTGIKYITYLEREESNELSKKYNSADYRTYTYSIIGYKELLSESGFKNVEFYYPAPDYKRIESVHNLEHVNVSSYVNKSNRLNHPKPSLKERTNDIEKALIETQGLSPFSASYSIIARKVVN